MDNNEYRIGELAEKAGVTKRTIHYYVSRGLLPAPQGTGLGTTYNDEHLYRIKLIKKMQDEYLPLDEIRRRISSMKISDVIANLDGDTQLIAEEAQEDYLVNSEYGVSYQRISIGPEIELHFPRDSSKRTKEMVEKIIKYSENILKEG